MYNIHVIFKEYVFVLPALDLNSKVKLNLINNFEKICVDK